MNPFSIQPETSFQNVVDHQFSGADRSRTDEFPDGQFGVGAGDDSQPPRWTLHELEHDLWGEYWREIIIHRANFKETETQIVGIIQKTVNAYARLLGIMKKGAPYSNADEFNAALARVTA